MHISSLQTEAKQLTESLWKEQARCKQAECELNDVRLIVKNINAENAELRMMVDREKSVNLANIEKTRSEIEKMRDRQEREQKGQQERIFEALSKEAGHFRNLCEELERHNR